MKLLLPAAIPVPVRGGWPHRVLTDRGQVPAQWMPTTELSHELVRLELLSGTVLLLLPGTEVQLHTGRWERVESLSCGPCRSIRKAGERNFRSNAQWHTVVETAERPPGAAMLRSLHGNVVEVVRRSEVAEVRVPMWWIEFGANAMAIGSEEAGAIIRARSEI